MFKVGDKVRVINSYSMNHAREGIVTALGDGFSRVSFGTVDYYYSNTLLERMDDMDISERISEVIKENQEFKQKLWEQNIKLNKIQADLKRELNDKGVSDEEFRESVDFWLKSSSSLIAEVWGEDYKIAPMRVICSRSVPLSEFVNKYKEYKDKQNEIKVGDEITPNNNENVKAIVIYVSDDCYKAWVLRNGGVGIYTISHTKIKDWHKTGRHFDEIDTIISALRGSD